MTTDSTYDPRCSLCVLKYGEKLIEWQDLLTVVESLDNERRPIPGAYLAIPKRHITNMAYLPPDWNVQVGDAIGVLKRERGITIDNRSTNLTTAGGLSVLRHYHEHLLDRAALDKAVRHRTEDPPLTGFGFLEALRRLAVADGLNRIYRNS